MRVLYVDHSSSGVGHVYAAWQAYLFRGHIPMLFGDSVDY